MKTVLFIGGSKLYDSYRRSRRMFNGFVENGQIVEVPWLMGSPDFSPDEVNAALADVIGEDEKWRALVVSDLSHESLSDYACGLRDARAKGEDSPLLESKLSSIAPYIGEAGADLLRFIGLDIETAMFTQEGNEVVPRQSFHPNPFDFVQNLCLSSYPSTIQHPVVKLAQQLAGLPAHVRDEGSIGLSLSQIDDLLVSEAGKSRLVPAFQGEGRERRQAGDFHDGVLLDAVRKTFPETTVEGYRPSDLALKCPRPNDVILVSYRDVPSNVPASSLNEPAGCVGAVGSEFAIRNHYPDATRFVVVDRERTGSEKRIKGDMAFWSALLVMALNTESSFGMRSYALYQLEAGVDYDRFAEELQGKYGYAISARRLLEERLRVVEGAFEPDEDRAVSLPSYSSHIIVDFKVPDEAQLDIPVRKYGWLKDSLKPRESELGNLAFGLGSASRRMKETFPLDEARYGEDRARLDRAMEETLEEPRYALQAAARDFHDVEPLPDDVLTGLKLNIRQADVLERELNDCELRLAGSYSLSLFDADMFKRLMTMVDKRAKTRMQPRSYLREVAIVAAVVIVAGLVSFVPYIFGCMGGIGGNVASAVLSAGVVALLLGVGALSLKVSHWQVRSLLRNVNEYIRFLLGQLRVKADELGDRISEYATYQKGYSLFARQGDGSPAYTVESLALRSYRHELNRQVEGYEEDFEALEVEPDRVASSSFLTWAQAKSALDTPGYFDLEPELFQPERPLNGSRLSGEKVRVPYRFIKWLELREIRLYEPGYEKGVVR